MLTMAAPMVLSMLIGSYNKKEKTLQFQKKSSYNMNLEKEKNGETRMKKYSIILRIIIYIAGLLILAFGIILNTKSGLGVSPIISVAYSISTIWNLNFGDTTFALYTIFVMIEMLLHTLIGRSSQTKWKNSLVLTLGKDLLQLPLSLVFTRFMNLFSGWIPAPSHGFGSQIIGLILGIICTGVGAAMSLDMRLIPNPGDGIVQTIADCIHKPVGFTKNCFDMVNICITISVGMLFAHKLIGVGIGTVIAVLGVGRVIALFNWLCMKKIVKEQISGQKIGH